MRRRGRKKRTQIIVIFTMSLLCLTSEILYVLRDHFQVATVIETALGPFERWILPKS